MDAKLKAKWVKALRSGRYRQGIGSLYSRRRYCCLGVLAITFKRRKEDIKGFAFLSDHNNCHGLLEHDAQKGLASMNDVLIPFDVIAGFIHENL